MNVQVEDPSPLQRLRFQAGLFQDLFLSHPEEIRITVGVSPRLEPLIELSVVYEKDPTPRGVNHPARGGKVACFSVPGKGEMALPEERQKPVRNPLLLWLLRAIFTERSL